MKSCKEMKFQTGNYVKLHYDKLLDEEFNQETREFIDNNINKTLVISKTGSEICHDDDNNPYEKHTYWVKDKDGIQIDECLYEDEIILIVGDWDK